MRMLALIEPHHLARGIDSTELADAQNTQSFDELAGGSLLGDDIECSNRQAQADIDRGENDLLIPLDHEARLSHDVGRLFIEYNVSNLEH